jgi:hypothetical protein
VISCAGELPAQWGTARTMPAGVGMYFTNNPGITGSIPQSWVWFSSAYIDVANTNVSGCIPGTTLLMLNNAVHSALCPDSGFHISAKRNLGRSSTTLAAAKQTPETF